MHKQGIVTRLSLEPVHIFNKRVHLLSLFIDGVHENGNKVMLSHWKKAEIFDVSSIKISLYSYTIGGKSSTNLATNEIELDIQIALDILEKKEKKEDARHELTLGMFTLGAHVNKPSIFHTQFRAISGKSKIGIYLT